MSADCFSMMILFECEENNSDTSSRGNVLCLILSSAIDRWTKRYIPSFSKTCDLEIAQNYRCITLTSIAVKIYNALLCNRIEPKVEKILRKNKNGFRWNRFTTSQILTINRILGVRAKTSKQYYYSSTSPRRLNPYTEERWSKYFSPTAYPPKLLQP